jgi:hypothetical protein
MIERLRDLNHTVEANLCCPKKALLRLAQKPHIY